MKQQNNEGNTAPQNRKGRGPTKSYPTVNFQEAFLLARNAWEKGINGRIDRLALMRALEIAPNSQKTRSLLTASSKYGLTSGSHRAPSVQIKETAFPLFEKEEPDKQDMFNFAIGQFECFYNLFEGQKGQHLRDMNVLKSELENLEVSASDSQKVTQVFIENLQFLGLLKDIEGQRTVIALEGIDASVKQKTENGSTQRLTAQNPVNDSSHPSSSLEADSKIITDPSIHIDIQIHIDASASSNQIDQIFSSMARHLYGREER